MNTLNFFDQQIFLAQKIPHKQIFKLLLYNNMFSTLRKAQKICTCRYIYYLENEQ